MKSIRIALASLAIALSIPVQASAGGFEDKLVQGILGAVVDGVTGGGRSYGSRAPSYRYDRYESDRYDRYEPPRRVVRSRNYRDDHATYTGSAHRDLMTKEYYYDRYGPAKVRTCARDRQCARELDRVGRMRSQAAMDDFFDSF